MKLEEHVPLARFTTIGTGGAARWFARPQTVDELAELVAWAAAESVPIAVVGLGSNLLVADEGFEGLALRLTGALASIEITGTRMTAGGGASLAVCLHRARDAELGGLEFACAIPGTVGGAVWMNAGAYDSDLGSVLTGACVADVDGVTWLSPAELGLRYRHSDLHRGQVVAMAELQLEHRAAADIRARIRALQEQRKAAQPTNRRTFGSVFKNPEHELSAGRMLEACALRGFRLGGAQISPKHANFIENAGGASTADVLALIAEARRRARDAFGVVLEPEVQLLGEIAIPPLD